MQFLLCVSAGTFMLILSVLHVHIGNTYSPEIAFGQAEEVFSENATFFEEMESIAPLSQSDSADEVNQSTAVQAPLSPSITNFAIPPFFITGTVGQLQLVFEPTPNTLKTNLAITTLDGANSSSPTIRMEGSTRNNTAVFVSDNLGYRGENVSLVVGDVIKNSSEDFQITFGFDVRGEDEDHMLIYTHGPLSIQGWEDDKYYQNIDSNSTTFVDFPVLIAANGDRYSFLERVIIAMSRNSSLDRIDFRIET